MPKNKSKKASKGRNNGVDMSDSDSMNDNMSIVSVQSNYGDSVEDGNNNTTSEEVSVQERNEEKLSQAIDNATEKSAQTRCNALQTMCEILQHRYLPDFIEERKVTIQDIVEKSLKRGKGAEQGWAAQLASLLIIQLGVDDQVATALCDVMQILSLDNAVGYEPRAKCCTALGLLRFFGTNDSGIGDVWAQMRHFEQIFSGSYLKGDQTPSSASVEAAALHSAALNAWSLLLTLIPSGDFVSMTSKNTHQPSMMNLIGMLESPHLEVRMAAGEALALVLESGRAHDENFMEEYMEKLIERTKQLATDFHKYRAKRDRKTQRATFRDVLRYIEEDDPPEINIRFGVESLQISSWSLHHQYSALCTVIGPGITSHLTENEFLREVLQLGAKLLPDLNYGMKQQSKQEKHLMNAAAFKARTITRGKNRDKRSAVIT